MNNDEMIACKKQILEDPTLTSARQGLNYATFASVLNLTRAPDAQLTDEDAHAIWNAVIPEPAPTE